VKLTGRVQRKSLWKPRSQSVERGACQDHRKKRSLTDGDDRGSSIDRENIRISVVSRIRNRCGDIGAQASEQPLRATKSNQSAFYR
jgi:hypothetical protein